MEIYEQTVTLHNADVDMHRRLRLSVLFTLLQESAIAHTTLLGAGREKTLDRGLLWVIALQQADITRLPEYDETVTLQSWPGSLMHVFFPRYYRLLDAAGGELVRGCALWALMRASSRAMVFPEEEGVAIPGVRTGWETPLPRMPRPAQAQGSSTFTVPYSYTDLNGHMNNTRYFDLMQDTLPLELTARTPRCVRAEYTAEARCGTEIALHWARQEDCWQLWGEGDKRLFRLAVDYDPAL